MSEIRRLELSSKFLQMGQALLTESIQTKDAITEFAATFMITLSNVIVDDNDTYLFNELCNMYTGRKILDNLTQEQDNNPIVDYMKAQIGTVPPSPLTPKKRVVRKKKGPDETPPTE